MRKFRQHRGQTNPGGDRPGVQKGKQPTPIYEFGLYRLDVAERLLLREGRLVPLPPKVFDTLIVLLENSGRLVEKDEMMKRLWPDTFVEEATLARNISDLRKALNGPRDDVKCIEVESCRT